MIVYMYTCIHMRPTVSVRSAVSKQLHSSRTSSFLLQAVTTGKHHNCTTSGTFLREENFCHKIKTNDYLNCQHSTWLLRRKMILKILHITGGTVRQPMDGMAHLVQIL
ncbi:uncharacterized protein LOC118764511 [Octopus sinensis]|uniref:Uncharacterized protein LOC118764511 n=1 Tax=Octopus sinensis TaxID=2607531 RepID=A0A7E6F010_9MOLL|nr:uncharacterized protein LOC118764511 [Octopus sinensis]